MTNTVKVNLRGTEGIVSSYQVSTSKQNATVIKVPRHGAYNIELLDEQTGLAPQVVMTKRVGDDLWLVFDEDDKDAPDVILENYYDNDQIHLIGQAENGQYYEYIPTSGDVNEYTAAMVDGQSSEAVLGGEGSFVADPSAESNHFAWLPFLLLGGAGAAGVAYAVSHNKDDDGGNSKSQIKITINSVKDLDNDGRPEFSGSSSSPNSKVTITFPDGKIITTTTDKNGNWSIEAPSSQPNGTVTVTVTDANGNTGSASGKYEDTTAPDSPAVKVNNDDELSGKAEPGAKVTITDPETGKTTTVEADDNGNWSIHPNPIGEGDGKVTIVAEDPAGNISSPTYVARPDHTAPNNETSGIIVDSISLVDDVAPVTGVIADGSRTNDTRPTYSGKATADIDHVNIYDNGVLVGRVKTGSDGSWSYTPSTSLAEGSTHEYSVSAVDKAGNEGPRVSGTTDTGWTFTIDTLPPDNSSSGIVDGSLGLLDDVGPQTGTIPDGGVTDDARPTFSGQATDDIDHVNIYDNGELIGSAEVQPDGSWRFTPETDLAEGDHAYTVSAVDRAGNEGPQIGGADDSWNFTVDTTAPGAEVFESGSISLTDDVGPVQGRIDDGSTTDDAQPTYTGRITEAGLSEGVASVNIYDKGVLIGSAAVDQSSGAWSFTPSVALASGGHSFTVAAVDAAGNEGPQVSGTADESWDFTLQTSAPAQPSIENVSDNYTHGEDADTGYLQKGQVTNDSTLTVNGTAGAGMTVQIWATDSDNNRVQVGEGVADETGRWSITTAELGEDGSYSLTATAVNAAGVSSAETGGFAVVLDTTPPDAAVATLLDDQGDDQGEVPAGGVTDDSTPQLTGTGEAGATVSVYVDGSSTAVDSVVVDSEGRWTLSLGNLTDGEHSYQTKITDAAGNETRGESVSFTVDSSAVEITLGQVNDNVGSITGAVLNNGLTDDSTPELQGTTKPGATVTIRDEEGTVLGTATADAQGVWKYQLETVEDGTHSWTAEVTNEAGNTARAEITVTVDSTPPAAPVITAMEDDVGTVQKTWTTPGADIDDPAPTFTGTAEPGTLITIYDGESKLGSVTADEDGNWSYTPTTNLVDGEHNISVTSTDAAGNESSHSQVWNFTLDTSTTAPVITTNTTDEISGKAEPGATITITDPTDGSETSVVADKDGNWSLRPNPLEPGDEGVTIVATDTAGNSNSTVIDGPLDTTAPDNSSSGIVDGSLGLLDDVGPQTGTIPDGGVTDDARPTFSGQATDDIDHVNIYDNGELIGSAEVQPDGSWRFTPETDLAEGDHAYTVSAVDRAGNEGPQIGGADDSWNFTVDTTAPGAEVFESGSISLTDDVGPVQGRIDDGSTTDDAQPTYTGRITEAGLSEGVASVNIYDKGVLIGSAAVDQSSGAWSFTPSVALASGGHSFTVAAVDAAGNEGPQVSGTADESWDFTLQTSAPAQPSIENVSDNYTHGEDADTGYLQKGQVTNDSTLTVNGTAGAGMTVQIWATDSDNNRVQVGEGVADETGRWSITTAELGEDGSYSLTATAVNAAGVSSAETGGFAVVLDTTPPDAAVATLLDDQGDDQGEVPAGGVTDDSTPQLTGTGEAGATVSVYVDGSSTAVDSVVVDSEGRWTLSLGNLTDGEHSYQTKITDAAGNETRGESVSFTVDSSAVEITLGQVNDNVGSITGAVLNNGLTDDSTPELQGTTKPGATVTIRDEEGTVLGTATADAQGVWKYQLETVEDGTHSWTAEVTNEAGNTARAEITVTVDSTPPAAPVIAAMEDDVGTVQFVSPVQGNVTDDPAPTFTGTAEAGAIVTLYDGTNVLGSVTASAEGIWSYTPTTNLVEGTHSITAIATDAVGNVSEPSATWDFVLDITAPNVGISGNSAESLSGQSEPGALITVEDAAGTKYTAVADQNGRWIISPNPITAGESGKIYATDPAGNVGDPVAFQGSALASYDLLNESSQVNTTVTGDQANPSSTRLADGRIVVVWQGDGNGTDVYMQLYEADGVHKIGTEQQINQRTSGDQDSAQVVALVDGGFLVVYESYGGGLDNSGDGIVARRYGADGQAVTDEFLVNTTTAGSQRMPSAVGTADGGYIISWESGNQAVIQRIYDADNQASDEITVAAGSNIGAQGGPEMALFTDEAHSGMYITVWNATGGPSDSASTGVVGQIFGADGQPLGDAFQVNTTTDKMQNYPDVITLADGSVVVFWDTDGGGAVGSDIRAAHYRVDPETGHASLLGSGDFVVNSYTAGKQYKPVGVALEDGGYLIIWGSEGGDGSGSAIYAQRYDADDNRVGREFMINTTTQGNQGTGGDSVDVTHILDATLTADGNVYVSWQSDNVDGSGMGVEGIVIDPDAAYYSEFTVNSTTAGNQTDSQVVSLPSGGVYVVWVCAEGSGTVIKGQMLDARGQPVGQELTLNTTTAGDQLSPQVTVLAEGGLAVTWSSGNAIKGQKIRYTYDSDGSLSGAMPVGAEISVSSGESASNVGEPAITALEDGGYLVVWQAVVDGKWQICSQQYTAEGQPLGQQTLATTELSYNFLVKEWPPLPSVTTLSDGKVVITYTDKGTGYDTVVQLYDPASRTAGEKFVANQTLTKDQASPSVSALDNGNFVVTWDSDDNSGPDQTGYSVWGRLYDADGNALTKEFIVNTATAGDQHLAKVVSRPDGSFVAVFISATDADAGAGTSGIYAQYFDARGNKVGQQMQINQLTYGEQVEVDATFMEGGQLYVSWTDKGVADGSGSGIKGRIVDLVETLGIEHQTPQNNDPTLIDYQPSTNPAISGEDTIPPNVGISANTAEKLGGQTEPGAIVTVRDANDKVHTAVADSNGAWSLEPNPLAVGDTGYISVSDEAGNQSTPILISGSVLDNYDLLNESSQVNTTVTGDQANPSSTRLADGRIVVVWQGDGNGTDVYMQLYEADGVHKIGTEQQINQRTSGDQDSAQVVALVDGGFLVVYESYGGGLDNSGDGIVARRYGADGQAVTDEFLVNTTTAGSQRMPSAVGTADGGYIISWESGNQAVIQRIYDADNQASDEITVAAGSNIGAQGGPEMALFTDEAHSGMYITVWNATGGPSDSASTGVVGQIFGADGQPLGDAFQVNTTTDKMQNYPDVITLADGSVVVFWDTDGGGAVGSDIRAAHYRVDPETGHASLLGSGDFVVNSYTAGKQYKPVGVALEDGGYLIIWGSEGGDGSGSAIYAQRYDADDNRVGREFMINTTTQGNQGTGGDSVDVTHILDATLTADGNVYVSWQSDNVDGSGMGVEGIVIDPDAAYYSEFTVNSTTAGNQTDSQVVSLPSGGVYVVWVCAEGSGTVIKGQMLDARGQPVGQELTLNTTTAGDQLSPQVTVLAEGGLAVTWSSGNAIKGQKIRYTYDSDGSLSGAMPVGAEISVSSGESASNVGEPAITALEDGGYLVVWQAVVDGKWQICSQQYTAEGQPLGQQTLATTELSYNFLVKEWPPLPSVTTLSDGKVVITYTDKGTGYDTVVQLYDPASRTAGEKFVANQTLTKDQASPSVSALDNGNFVVTWDSDDNSGPDQTGYSVWGRLYDADGNALTKEFIVNTATAGDQHLAKVVSRPDGSFVAVFISATDADAGAGTSGIYAQYFDARGNKVGQQMQINQLTYGEQVEVDATFMEGGQLYVSWTDKGVADGSGSGIKGRIVDLVETLGLSDTGEGVTHIEYQPAQYYLNGTEGNDALDGRGAITVDGKGGDDTIFINSTSFTSINGGEGNDTLVWDSNNNFELGSVSSKITGIETIHMGNNTAQMLVISANDILEMTKDNGEDEHVLLITGDDGDSNTSGARDTVSINKDAWSMTTTETNNNVSYDVYVHNDDSTIKLMIQHGLNVV